MRAECSASPPYELDKPRLLGADICTTRNNSGIICTDKDDRLPPRLAERLEGGPTNGWRVDLDIWQRDRAVYYGMMWDPERGLPTQAKFCALVLDRVADEWELHRVLPG